VPDDFGHVQTVAPAKGLDGFIGLKSATGAAADVEAAKEGALRAGKNLQNAPHGSLRGDGIVHEPKNF
jgi:hypothetical protein